MPTYEYECLKCKKTFDTYQSIKDKALTSCPKDKCRMRSWGKGKIRRVLSGGAGFIFKGTGFYITDYRSEGYKQAAKKDAEAAAPKKEGDSAPKKTVDASPKKEASSPKKTSSDKSS